MKNKSKDLRYKRRRAKLEKLMQDPEKFQSLMGTEITEKDVPLVHEIARDSRIEDLIERLNIDKDKFEKARKKIIKLSPNSTECHMTSTLFREHNGNYLVEDLLYEYHDSILKEGLAVGEAYGNKFLLEDIQSNRFTKEDLMKMSKRKIDKYCDEVRDEI
ncbi:MAG: hypothetical protein IJ258_09145 [Methanobrevibacter sp.]|uniref:hypothetical protein n=1 Tax=Methanobrevibacter sp. TaxID=66852 RepID=UPI0025D2B658|nr:hypothetical protein [Methanobrevibacter sp.]MBQ8018252.1 hypothetical protein [Methanobrevibacter sp.]